MNDIQVPTIGDLVPLLTRLALKSHSGSVHLEPPGGVEGSGLIIQLTAGALSDAVPLDPPSILEQTIYESDILTPKELKRLTKQAQQEQWSMPELALAQGLLPAEELSAAVVDRLEAILGETLAGRWTAREVDGIPIDLEVAGLAQYFQLALSVDELLLGAARRHGLWHAVRDCLPELKEVYGATPEAAPYIDAGDEYTIHTSLIQEFDGLRDLAEVLERGGHDPFASWDVAMALREAGAIEAANPVQLFQIGCDVERNGEYLKALRLFERAEQRGLDDFDLGYRLGELYHRNGRDAEAVERFMAFAEKCVGQYRIEDTIRSCRRIIDIDPDNMQVLERYVSLLARYGKRDEALHEGLMLARRFADADEPSRALTTLEKIFDLAEANEEVLRFYLDLCNRTGHQQGAIKAQRRLGNLFHQRADTKKALEFYQGLFCNGEDTADIRSRLCELHFNAGNRDRALEHLESLQRMPGWSPRNPDKEAVDYLRRLLNNGVREPTVTAWLADEARIRGSRDETLRYLDLHCQLLEAAGRLDEARRSAVQLVRLDPRNANASQRLSSLEMRTGDAAQAALVLEQLAHRLADEGSQDDQLREILEELITINPLSLSGRDMLLPRTEGKVPSPARSRQLLEMALLKTVMGEYARAEVLLDEFPEGDAVRLHLYALTGFLNLWHDRDQGAHWILKSARLAAERGERHTLETLVGELKKIDAAHPELEALERTLLNLPDPRLASHVRGPEKLKTKVAGITARLRTFKSGGGGGDGGSAASDVSAPPETAVAAPSPTPVKSGGSLQGVDALKNMRIGDSKDEGKRVAGRTAKKGVDALKRLRGSKGDTATSEPPPAGDASADGASGARAEKPSTPSVANKKPANSRAQSTSSSSAKTGAFALKKLRNKKDPA